MTYVHVQMHFITFLKEKWVDKLAIDLINIFIEFHNSIILFVIKQASNSMTYQRKSYQRCLESS